MSLHEVGVEPQVVGGLVTTSRRVFFDGFIGAPLAGAFITVLVTLTFWLTGDSWALFEALFFGFLFGAIWGGILGVISLLAVGLASVMRPKFDLVKAQNRDLIWVGIAVEGVTFAFYGNLVLAEVLRDPFGEFALQNALFAAGVVFLPPTITTVWMKFIRRFSYLEQVISWRV